MRKRLLLVLILILILIPTSLAQAGKPLKFETTYNFVGLVPSDDGEGRSVVWEGTAVGKVDGQPFEGELKYWMHDQFDPAWNKPTGTVVHWRDMIVEIFVDGELVLKARADGSSTILPQNPEKSARWRANGRIIEVGDGFGEWMGRRFHDGGDVIGDFPLWSGEGKLHIN